MCLISGKRILSVIILIILTTFNICLAKDFVVVIDPGHGGKDFGAIGSNSYEKDINLGVALKLGDLIEENLDDVKIVYTRSTDRFLTLQQRANVANKAEGDLFISIHTNSVSEKSKNRNTINGAATYTLGLHKTKENLEVAKRENAVIELESDHSEAYKGFDPNSTESYIIFEISQYQHVNQSIEFASIVQEELTNTADRKNNGVRQAGFWVLAATSMPAVLVELDFICNPKEEKFLTSYDGQKKLATAIYNAFKKYKSSIDNKENILKQTQEKGEINKPKPKIKQNRTGISDNKKKDDNKNYDIDNATSKVSQNKDNNNSIIYKVQILTSAKKLRPRHHEFRKLAPIDSYYENGLYKYTYGETTDEAEAIKTLEKIKTKFKDAFIVKFLNGKRIK